MTQFKKYKLGELCKERNQGVNTTTEKVSYSTSGYKVIRALNILQGQIDYSKVVFVDEKTFARVRKECKPKNGDILYTNIGSQMGNAATVKDNFEFMTAWNVLRLVPDKTICNTKYLESLLNQKEIREFIRNMNSSSTMPFISGKEIANIEFDLPDLPTQTLIASILSSLDDKIELNRRTNQTLEQIAQTLFKKYFVDDIDPENLPQGWRWGKLGEIISFRNGKSSPNRTGLAKIPVYGSNGIIGYCDVSNANGRSIIIGRVGSFCGSLYYSLGKSYVTDNAIIAETIYNNTSTYCYLLLESLNLNNFRGGSGQPLINQTVLSGIDIIIPEITTINKYEELAYSFYQKIFSNENENSYLSKIRDSLLPKLMSGEIEVNVAEKELEN
jgi:type I restriction enzyme, S subunit